MLLAALTVKLALLVLCVLVSIAFITLLERKILGYLQKRKGPNKVGVKGVLQPFSDAIKLFTKEPVVLPGSNSLAFLVSPALSLGIMIIMWLSFPSSLGMTSISLSVIFIMCCLSVGVYPVLGAGWASNSKYPLLGSLRSVAQTLSYEVSLAFILLSYVVLTSSFNLERVMTSIEGQWLLFMSLPLAAAWFITSLAETNRTPFDFSEGESELVSGFNTEYSSGGFALFFLAEYGSILFMSLFFAVIFMGGLDMSVSFPVKVMLVVSMFIWVRGTLPRLRYDKLMMMAWKSFLPVSLGYLMAFFATSSILSQSVWF
uniref:NADH-ubiquinone oxidoreductase chain 1 n=1 Tax=Ligia oceanica TaxID=96856 RepID=Q09TE4_LIGOC|nr:NADH dehydrogenase subunit 1 [Ligia oceanica]